MPKEHTLRNTLINLILRINMKECETKAKLFAPVDAKEVVWEDINGKTGKGVYVKQEDSFVEENGDFVFRQFVKKWSYV
jgi:hypothetical protein